MIETAGWRRLHPLSPLVRLGRLGVILAVVVISTAGGSHTARGSSARFIVTVVICSSLGVMLVLGGVVSWLVTRWRIHEGALQIEMGLIRRQSFRVPLERIQAIDVVAPLLARGLGLAEVRVVSAGRGLEHCRLAYVRAVEAPVIRAQLLALAHGLDVGTPEPPAVHLMAVDNGRLAASLLLRAGTLAPLGVYAVFFAIAAAVGNRTFTLVVGSLFTVLLGTVFANASAFNSDFGFTISAAPDGLRLDRGLLKTRHETLPYGRIQGVRWVEPLLWRPFGWSRLEVDVARQGISRESDRGGTQVARLLMPVARREHTAWLLWHIMPGATFEPPPGSRPPRRARLKAPLSYHFLASWHDAHYICARTGRFQASTVIVPVAKVQSVRLAVGPLQRALAVATVHVDTAGRRWQASARSRDALEAGQLVNEVAVLARQARHATAPVTS